MDRGASVQFSSVAQLCPTLCDPMNRSSELQRVKHDWATNTRLLSHVFYSLHLNSYEVPQRYFSNHQNKPLMTINKGNHIYNS